MTAPKFLPGTGRWQPEGLTEGLRLSLQFSAGPSTNPLRGSVPLPVPGRNK